MERIPMGVMLDKASGSYKMLVVDTVDAGATVAQGVAGGVGGVEGDAVEGSLVVAVRVPGEDGLDAVFFEQGDVTGSLVKGEVEIVFGFVDAFPDDGAVQEEEAAVTEITEEALVIEEPVVEEVAKEAEAAVVNKLKRNTADGKLYFDPGLPECRDFIDTVVRDILVRYDIDALHMDDYFYPYPVTGVEFPDTASYNEYGIGWDKNDWRRHNVDLLIEQLHNTIQEVKPWVRFGISPFGIWRNKANDPDGSETNGLQCYDALYADCPKWTAEGWVDYMVPQLYWELEHKAASDLVLMHWWNDHANGRHMYYGQALNNVMSHQDIADEGGDPTNPTQLDHKMRLQRAMDNVHGVTWWPGYTITSNFKGVLDSLSSKQTCRPALIPAYTWLDAEKPHRVNDLKIKKVSGKKCLVWQAHDTDDPMQQAVRYVIYRFPKGKKGSLDNADAILAITGETTFALPDGGKGNWQYAVTALDRCWNESDPVWK